MKDIFMATKPTTIFRQLLLNVVIPPILALLLLGFLNFNHTRRILVESNLERNYIIGDEIMKVLEFQDVALGLVELSLDERMKGLSSDIEQELAVAHNIEEADLDLIRKKVGMNPIMEDIYIINRNGIVINTTFKDDLGLDFFSFGEEHKDMLLNVFEEGVFQKESFAIEAKTQRLKKYSYQPTIDNKYIIQIGVYSQEADEIIDFITNTTEQIAKDNETIESVDLFIGTDNTFFSLNKHTVLKDEHIPHLNRAFKRQDTVEFMERVDGERFHHQFTYMDRKSTELYKGSVIRITSSLTHDYQKLRKELIKFVSIFVITLLIVIILIWTKTKVITSPIKNLVSKVNRITHGHLNERAEIVGNNEITTLSKQFNKMIEELESYYNELEQKVEERTKEIQQQKEEIESQRDSIEDQRNMLADRNESLQSAYNEIEAQKKHITDSIVYAKRIQNAILPAQKLIDNIIKENFVLYMPKDIVSGDFYWVETIGNKSVIAAVDCTGHGVPGAFMSIIGSNQLNHAIHVKKAETASEILDALNEGVSLNLQQEMHTTRVRDGMDIAICVIDYETRELEYAGAYNPLYLIRNGELVKYKADKFAIGTYLDYPDRKYTNNKMQLEENDVIYIFSDGYADQFGGEKGRKFMYKQFQRLLVDIVHEPFEKQKQILEQRHVEWRGDNEVQVDDIIIIGLRV